MVKRWSEFLDGQRERAGVLRQHLPTFVTAHAGRGYAKSTAEHQIRLVAELGRWLERRNLLVRDLDEQRCKDFLRYRQRQGLRIRAHRTTVRILLEVLRNSGVTRSRDEIGPPDGADPFGVMQDAFKRHVLEERGLSEATLINYVRVFRRFLHTRVKAGAVDLNELRASAVTEFVAHEARSRSRHMQVIVPATRLFLRWLYQRGEIRTDLARCVPAVANWRLATVPKAISPKEIARLLGSCDRATAAGRRDYAILLLLARLGLRAGEVVALHLDDIDWERGEVVVHGKGKRQDRLPLPQDVGAALAAYLRQGRPRCLSRRVFVRTRAPYQEFSSSVAVCNIIERGFRRVKLEPSRKGAHALRHALACAMLRHGASLPEIGQILRHRSCNTTAIYAKVDLSALRGLAPAWPRSAGVA